MSWQRTQSFEELAAPGLPAWIRVNRLPWLLIGLVSVMPLAMLVDLPISRFCLLQKLPGDIRDFFTVWELFAHGVTVLFIVITTAVLDGNCGRGQSLRILASAYGAGLAALGIKLLVGRLRPNHEMVASVQETFVGLLPAARELNDLANRGIQSLPSGHTATAFGLAVALGFYYPRGRWLFGMFACFVAIQRVQVGAHYLSDTVAGAAVGVLVAWVCFDKRLLGGWFDRLERPRGESPKPAAP